MSNVVRVALDVHQNCYDVLHHNSGKVFSLNVITTCLTMPENGCLTPQPSSPVSGIVYVFAIKAAKAAFVYKQINWQISSISVNKPYT